MDGVGPETFYDLVDPTDQHFESYTIFPVELLRLVQLQDGGFGNSDFEFGWHLKFSLNVANVQYILQS